MQQTIGNTCFNIIHNILAYLFTIFTLNFRRCINNVHFHVTIKMVTSHALEADLAANLLVLSHCCFFNVYQTVESSRLMQCVKSSCIYSNGERIAPPNHHSKIPHSTTGFQHFRFHHIHPIRA